MHLKLSPYIFFAATGLVALATGIMAGCGSDDSAGPLSIKDYVENVRDLRSDYFDDRQNLGSFPESPDVAHAKNYVNADAVISRNAFDRLIPLRPPESTPEEQELEAAASEFFDNWQGILIAKEELATRVDSLSSADDVKRQFDDENNSANRRSLVEKYIAACKSLEMIGAKNMTTVDLHCDT